MKTRTKNLKKIFNYFLEHFNCKDLVLSLSYDDNKLMFSVAVHKSKKYKYDGLVQIKSVQIGETALDENVYPVLDQCVDYFRTQLIEKAEENEAS
jgi:hypothetical protein